MPTELVLLSEVEPTFESILPAVTELQPDARFLSYRDGEIGQFVGPDGAALLTVFRTRPVSLGSEAADCLADPPTAFGLWTDVTIPYGDAKAGRELAEKIAAAVGGTIRERK
mgnify:CR=1 FL=1